MIIDFQADTAVIAAQIGLTPLGYDEATVAVIIDTFLDKLVGAGECVTEHWSCENEFDCYVIDVLDTTWELAFEAACIEAGLPSPYGPPPDSSPI